MKSRNVINPKVRTGLLRPSSIAGAIALMFAVASAPTPATELSYRQVLPPAVQQSPQVASVALERPRIQLAIILDTSGRWSMNFPRRGKMA